MVFNSIFYKRFFIAVIALVLVVWVFYYVKEVRSVNYTPTAYEKELISYFKEIALQSEYDDNPERTIKWGRPMILFVFKEQEFRPQMSAIKKTVDEINQLATDGFKIMLTDNLSNSNSVLYLCDKEKIAEIDEHFYEMLTKGIDYDISGLAYSEFVMETHVIDKALIFVNPEDAIDVQESTILEEITQSLGLAFDSKTYPNSIFYKDKNKLEVRIKEYSELDRDIVRLLYHPKMKAGLDSIELEKVIKKILMSEKD